MKRGEYLRMFQTFRKVCGYKSEVVYQRGNMVMTKKDGRTTMQMVTQSNSVFETK